MRATGRMSLQEFERDLADALVDVSPSTRYVRVPLPMDLPCGEVFGVIKAHIDTGWVYELNGDDIILRSREMIVGDYTEAFEEKLENIKKAQIDHEDAIVLLEGKRKELIADYSAIVKKVRAGETPDPADFAMFFVGEVSLLGQVLKTRG